MRGNSLTEKLEMLKMPDLWIFSLDLGFVFEGDPKNMECDTGIRTRSMQIHCKALHTHIQGQFKGAVPTTGMFT